MSAGNFFSFSLFFSIFSLIALLRWIRVRNGLGSGVGMGMGMGERDEDGRRRKGGGGREGRERG